MNKTIIRNLKRLMKSRGIETTYGFIKLGIAPQLVDGILSHGYPTLRSLEKLSIALECEITEFFVKEEVK